MLHFNRTHRQLILIGASMNAPVNTTGKYTYREYQCFPDDGKRHEIIDGDHYMSPAPSTRHQTVSRHLQFKLYTQIELPKLGRVFNAPTDVELAPHDIVQPDIFVVMNDRRRIILPKKVRGVPNLIIEILWESNPVQDRVLKFEMYRRATVEEYWIVDPDEEIVEQWMLQAGIYQLVGKHHDSVQPQAIANVRVDLLSVWED